MSKGLIPTRKIATINNNGTITEKHFYETKSAQKDLEELFDENRNIRKDLDWNYIYIIRMEIPNCDINPVKIGVSNDPINRIKDLQVGSPFPLKIIAKKKTSLADKLERILHRRFSSKTLKGEWFDLSDKDLEGLWLLDNGQTYEMH